MVQILARFWFTAIAAGALLLPLLLVASVLANIFLGSDLPVQTLVLWAVIGLLALGYGLIASLAMRLQAFARFPGLSLRNRVVVYGVLPAWAAAGFWWLANLLNAFVGSWI